MAIHRVNFELREMEFPFMSEQKGAGAFYNEEISAQYRPRVSWLNNLWPLSQGKWAAVSGTLLEVPPIPPEALESFYSNGVRAYTALVDNQRSYLLIGSTSWWAFSNNSWVELHEQASSGFASVFSLKGKTYIISAGEGLYSFDESQPPEDLFGAVELLSLTGVTATDFIAGCAALSYMILVTADTVYWSAPINNLYFSPGGTGDNYGAGSTKVLGIQSPIFFVAGTENGFYIFTEATVIEATYSGNPDNPWVFNVVDNSSGALSINYIVPQETLQTTFYWSESGLALLGSGQCQYLAPEVTELLAGDIYEDYSPLLRRCALLQTRVVYDLQVNFLGNRFLVLSYGLASAAKDKLLIFDTVLKQWFRLSYPHVAVTELISVSQSGIIFGAPEGSTTPDWTFTFDDTEQTFEAMMDSITNKQTNTVAVGLIGTDGRIYRMSPIRVSVSQVGEFILANQIQFSNLRVTKSQYTELHEVVTAFSYPTYPDSNGANTELLSTGTRVWAQSDENPIARALIPAELNAKEQRWVQRVQGQSLTVTIENIGSLTGVAFNLRRSGGRLK